MGFMRIDIEKFFNKTNDEKSQYVDSIMKNEVIRTRIVDNKYSSVCYPLIEIDNNEEKYRKGFAIKRVEMYRCSLHPNIWSIHLGMLFHHILFKDPEKHKEFITNEMFPP
jgi:hypothetical protein